MSRAAGRILLIPGTLLIGLTACSKPEPVDGFWGYRWGAPIDSVLADTAHIRTRFGEARYRFTRSGDRLLFDDVQYGLGYGRVTLDFSSAGGLWHGRIRIPSTGAHTVDSIVEALQDKHGGETAPRRIETPAGYVTYWQTRDWLDRDFYAAGRQPETAANDVRSVEVFAGGCPVECPLYSVRLLATGRAYLWSVRGHRPLGGFRGDFDRARFPVLAEAAARPEFLALASDYTYRGPNLTVYGIRVDYGTQLVLTRSTEHSGPPALEDLITEIEAIAGKTTWQQLVSWDTVQPGTEHRIHIDSLAELDRTATN